MKVPDSHQDLLRDDVKAFAYLATVMPDGSPQVTPVWFSWDGDNILINSASGRQKDRNMRNRPQVAVVIQDPKSPYRYIQVRGPVIDVKTEGARDHINFLSNKYNGNPVYPGDPNEQRVIYTIEPEHVTANG